MEGSFKKHNKKSMDLLEFRKCIVCHHLDTHVYHADPGRTGRPQKRNIDSRYEGLNHVTVKQGKQARCAQFHKNTTLRCENCNLALHVKCSAGYHTE